MGEDDAEAKGPIVAPVQKGKEATASHQEISEYGRTMAVQIFDMSKKMGTTKEEAFNWEGRHPLARVVLSEPIPLDYLKEKFPSLYKGITKPISLSHERSLKHPALAKETGLGRVEVEKLPGNTIALELVFQPERGSKVRLISRDGGERSSREFYVEAIQKTPRPHGETREEPELITKAFEEASTLVGEITAGQHGEVEPLAVNFNV